MNKDLFVKLCNRLKAGNDWLKFIDFDYGFLNITERPPIAFPAALIDIRYPRCEDEMNEVGSTMQDVTAEVIVKVAFQTPITATAQGTPSAIREKTLLMYTRIALMHQQLQGWIPNSAYSPLSRISAIPSLKADLTVFTITYRCDFTEGE